MCKENAFRLNVNRQIVTETICSGSSLYFFNNKIGRSSFNRYAGEVFKQRPAVLDARIKENDKVRNVSGLTDQEIQYIL